MTAPQCNPDLSRFWSRLTELQCGGQPLLSSLRTVEKELAGRPMEAVVKVVADDVEKGALLSAALRKRTDVFGRAATCFVEGGEYAGILDLARCSSSSIASGTAPTAPHGTRIRKSQRRFPRTRNQAGVVG